MKISYNPKSSQTAITTETAANDDIIFDLYTSKLWAKGVRIGADWADISSKPSSLKNPEAIKFKDINGKEVSYDGSTAKDLTTGTYIAKLPYGFAAFVPNPTWGNTSGTSIASWNDSNGGSIDFRKDNPSSGKMSIKIDGRVYVNEGANPVLSAEYENGFWGMRTPDGVNDYIKTSNNGLIPCVPGNAGSGHSSLGTSTWYFSTAYIDKVYGSLKGNADTATTATKATKADNATNAENADKLDGWHKDNIQWTGYITSGTADLQSYWFKIYDVTITNSKANDVTITFLVSDGYGSNFSIFYLKVRQNGSNGSGAYNLDVTLKELVGNLKNKIVAYYNDKTGNVQLWGDVGSRWGVLNYTILKKTFRTDIDFITLGTLTAKDFTSVQTQPTTDYTKVTMSRVGQVQYAESSSSSTQATKLQTARNLWGNSFDGTKDINGSIVFPGITDTAISNKISWNGSTDGADIYYQTTAKDQGNLVLNVRDDTNAYIQLALNGTFKSHFDVANSYWTGRSALADKWTTARAFTIGNTAKNVDGSEDMSWSLAEIGAAPSGHTHAWDSLTHSSTIKNQAILTNGEVNGWKLQTLNIANWDTAYNFVSTITGTDTDNVINKWDEIVNFLAGITEDNKLNTLLNSKLSVYKLADETNVSTIKNNGIYYSTTDASSSTLTNSPFYNGFALINMTSYDEGNDLRRSRLAFNAFGEIKVSNDRDETNTAETWYNVLTSKNSGIDGSTIKLNGTSITVYSSGTTDGRYVKKIGDTMSGVLTIGTPNFGALTIQRNDDINAAAIQFKGKSSVYGLIGLNNNNKDKQFLRWDSNLNTYTILDTSSTYTSNGKGIINGTTITQVDNATNADTIDGEHASAFTRIVGRHSITTTGTAPYNYIHLFRIANSNNNSTVDCEIDLRTRYHSAKLEIRIATSKPQYGNNGSNMSIIKKVINGRSCNFWFLETVQSSGYNYYDIYYQSWAWDGGTYDIILKGSNGVLVFEHKGINLDTLPDNVSIVNNQWVMWNDIAGKPSSFTPAAHNHDGRYLRLDGSDTMQGNLNLYSYGGGSYIGRGSGDKSGADFTEANIVIRSWWGISFKSFDDVVRTYIDTRTGNIGTKGRLISAGFIHSGVTDTKNANQYVLTADGGYTFLNQASNELAHEFDVSIAVTSEWQDIEDFYGGNQGFLTQPGTYIVQVYYKDASADGMYEGYFSGIMSWYTGKTNSNNADEIVLHRVGHAYANTIYLRTRESLSSEEKPYTKLQISANSDLKQHTYKFKFKRIC